MKNITAIKNAYTHGSVFHADDVFSTAMLLLINPDIIVNRTNDMGFVKSVADNDDCIVYDIGEGEYDHHQKDHALRPIEDGYYMTKDGRISGIIYCAFGLLWKDYGYLLCPEKKAWEKVDKELVINIDKNDNGISANLLTSALSQFNPNWDDDCSDGARYSSFMQAVNIAQAILRRYVNRANSEVKAEEKVKNSTVIDGKILVLDEYMPWQDVVVNDMPEILYVVFPSSRGGYNVQTVPDAPGSFTGRKLFPAKWLGNPDSSLGMTFCHPGNFLLATETKDQAINCAQIAAAT